MSIRPAIPLVLAACTASVMNDDVETDTETDVTTESVAPRDTSTEQPMVADGVEVTSGGPVACAEPDARLDAPFDTLEIELEAAEIPYMGGAGVALGDVDDDGDIDIFATTQDQILLFRQEPTGFAEEQILSQTVRGRDAFFGPALADADGDGDLDAFVSGYRVHNRYLRNDAGTFVDATAGSGLEGSPVFYDAGAAWADMDGDGDLDLAVAGHGYIDLDDPRGFDNLPRGSPSHLYENLGDGTFADVSDRLDDNVHDGHSFVLAWQDFDRDGLPDLYVANDFAEHAFASRAARNTGTGFVDVTPADLTQATTGMGLGAADVNEDGVVDLLLPGFGAYGLLVSGPAGWSEASRAAGLAPSTDNWQMIAWGSTFSDLDADGDLDLIGLFADADFGQASQPPDFPDYPGQRDALWEQVAPMVFEDRGPAWGLASHRATRAVAIGDLNADGFTDIVKASLDGALLVHRSRCSDAAWLQIELDQPGMNRRGIGARIEVQAGERTWTRWLRAGGTGYASSDPPEVHVGLGELSRVDEVRVHWPDGGTASVTHVQTRQRISLRRLP